MFGRRDNQEAASGLAEFPLWGQRWPNVEVAGESHHSTAIAPLFTTPVPEDGVEGTFTAHLVPEPTNRYDRNAVQVVIGGNLVGYLPKESAGAYQPSLLALRDDGRAATVEARVWARPEIEYDYDRRGNAVTRPTGRLHARVTLALAAPHLILPLNLAPGGLELPAGRALKLTSNDAVTEAWVSRRRGGSLPPAASSALRSAIQSRIGSGEWPSDDGGPEWMLPRLDGDLLKDHTNAVGTALMFSDMDLTPLRSAPLPGESPLAELRLTPSEASLIDNYLRNFPGMDVQPQREDIVRFTDGEHTLDVMNVNATGVESATGVDLIYYSHDYGCFVLVQYKRMEAAGRLRIAGIDERLPDQLKRMVAFDIFAQAAASGADPLAYRLGPGSTFTKFAYPVVAPLRESDLTRGLYVPSELLKRLHDASQLKGPQGGRWFVTTNPGRLLRSPNLPSRSVCQSHGVGPRSTSAAALGGWPPCREAPIAQGSLGRGAVGRVHHDGSHIAADIARRPGEPAVNAAERDMPIQLHAARRALSLDEPVGCGRRGGSGIRVIGTEEPTLRARHIARADEAVGHETCPFPLRSGEEDVRPAAPALTHSDLRPRIVHVQRQLAGRAGRSRRCGRERGRGGRPRCEGTVAGQGTWHNHGGGRRNETCWDEQSGAGPAPLAWYESVVDVRILWRGKDANEHRVGSPALVLRQIGCRRGVKVAQCGSGCCEAAPFGHRGLLGEASSPSWRVLGGIDSMC